VGRLAAADVHRLLEVTHDLVTAPSPQPILDRLVELVPAANAVQFNREGMVAFAGDIRCPPAVNEAAAEFALQRPTAPERLTPEAGAVTISARMSRRELHRLDFYQEAMRPIGVEDELVILLPTEPRARFGFSFLRERPFTERERTMLELLAPFLAKAASGACPRLTRREREIVDLVALGATNKEVAAALGLTANTIRTHLEHVYEKLGVHTRTAAVRRTNGGA
jgi:DNA-binding CsgD family transcriptional regulator